MGKFFSCKNLAQGMQVIASSICHLTNFVMSELNLNCALLQTKSNIGYLSTPTRIFWEFINFPMLAYYIISITQI